MRIRRSEFGISIQANVCTHWVVRVNDGSIEPVVTDTILGRHKHASAVTWVQVVLNYVVSSGDDGTVKLWDLATGDFIRDLVLLESAGSGGTVNFSVVKATTDQRVCRKKRLPFSRLGVVWRIKCTDSALVCAAGSRNSTEDTKVIMLDFDRTTICS